MATTENAWLMHLQEDIQRKIDIDKRKRMMKRKRREIQPASPRALYEAVLTEAREEQW